MRRLFSIIPVTVTMTVAVTIITVLGLLFTGGPLCSLFVATPHFGIGWFLSMFAHSSWAHYTGNILFFIPLSCILEMRYGSDKILTAIVLSGLLTGLSCVIGMHGSVGLSGVVYMLLMMLFFMVNWKFMVVIAAVAAVYWLLPELISIFSFDGVDHMSHLFNGIGGLGMGYAYNRLDSEN